MCARDTSLIMVILRLYTHAVHGVAIQTRYNWPLKLCATRNKSQNQCFDSNFFSSIDLSDAEIFHTSTQHTLWVEFHLRNTSLIARPSHGQVKTHKSRVFEKRRCGQQIIGIVRSIGLEMLQNYCKQFIVTKPASHARRIRSNCCRITIVYE